MPYKKGYSRYRLWQRVGPVLGAACAIGLILLVHACAPVERYKQRYGDWVEWVAVGGPFVLTAALYVVIFVLPKSLRTRRCSRCAASLEGEHLVNIDEKTLRCPECGHECPLTDVLDWVEIEWLVRDFLAGASSEEEKRMARQFRDEVIGHEERPAHTYLDTDRARNRWQLRWVLVFAGGGAFTGGLLGGGLHAIPGAMAGAFAGLVVSGVILLVKDRTAGEDGSEGE